MNVRRQFKVIILIIIAFLLGWHVRGSFSTYNKVSTNLGEATAILDFLDQERFTDVQKLEEGELLAGIAHAARISSIERFFWPKIKSSSLHGIKKYATSEKLLVEPMSYGFKNRDEIANVIDRVLGDNTGNQ